MPSRVESGALGVWLSVGADEALGQVGTKGVSGTGELSEPSRLD